MPATPVSAATTGFQSAALARGPIATVATAASPRATEPGNVAGAPITSAASTSPPASRSAAPACGRYVGYPRPKSTANGNPVCHVSTASAPERLPPPRSIERAQRVGPFSACASAVRASARSGSAGVAPGSASATRAT